MRLVTNLTAMKALASSSALKCAILHEPDSGAGRIYYFRYGDSTEADDFSIVEPDDGLGRWFVAA
jgi:hypothetical protein